MSIVLLGCVVACTGGGGGGALPPPPTATAIPSATRTETAVPTATASATASVTSTSTPTSTPTPQPTATATPTHTATPTATATRTPTATETPLTGPIVTAFEVADANGIFNESVGTDDRGRPIFLRQAEAGFILFVEGRPGASRLPVGTLTSSPKPNDPTAQPDLQIETSNNLGDGSPVVCDNSFPTLGGVPGIDPPNFRPIQSVTDALNDFGCRFRVFAETDFACTQDTSGNFLFRSSGSTVQFCTLVNDALTFPFGDTVLTVRLRDTAGNGGPSIQIVVRIPER